MVTKKLWKVSYCDSITENFPHRLIGSGTIRRCDLDVVGVASLEEVCY